MPRIITTRQVGGQDVVAVGTTPAGTLDLQSGFVTNFVPQGEAFWFFDSIPYGNLALIVVDWTGAPIAASGGTFAERKALNRAAMEAISVEASSVISYLEE